MSTKDVFIVHVGCAQKAGYQFGFDLQPVKSSRRDTVNTVKIGTDTGSMSAALWCPEHEIKTKVHRIDEQIPDSGQVSVNMRDSLLYPWLIKIIDGIATVCPNV